jgi:zinc transport system ATP-binding protein
MTKAIELTDVQFSYGSEPAIRDINFAIDEGDFCGIIGPNGGGKSTLLRLTLGVLKPQHGTVRLLGDDPRKTRTQTGYVPQETSSNKEFPISVHDVVLMGLVYKRGIGHPFTAEDHGTVETIIAEMGLMGLGRRRIGELSGGQRQKVLLARALVSKPRLVFLDEPTASIDMAGVDEIYEYLQKLNKQGTTVVLVTHNVGAVSKYVKSVACVNKTLFFHPDGKLTEDTLHQTFGCPIDLIAHGLPHRVFHSHDKGKHHG